MLWVFKGCGYVMGLRGLVILWVFKGFCYGIEGKWLCYGYLRGVVMLWVFKGCGYFMGI